MLAFYLSMLESADDKALFTEIYEQNIGKMFYIAKSILLSDSLADEAVHDTFIKIIKNFAKFSKLKNEHQKGWITITTKYTALNILKKEKKYIAVEDTYLFDVIDNQSSNEQMDTYEDLVEMIEELPEKYRDVLEMYYIQGYSNKEIAAMLNISVDNAMQRLSRARKLFQEKIESKKSN